MDATSPLTYGILSTALFQNPGTHAYSPETSSLCPALTPGTPLATPDPQRMFPESPASHSSIHHPLPKEAPQEDSRVSPLLFLGSTIVIGLSLLFPFVSAPSSLIRVVYMGLLDALWGAAWWLTSPSWNPGFLNFAPYLKLLLAM